jgi:glycosyltransferase involved in cell wall biosynthesis
VTPQKLRFCFVTEVDLKQIGGAVTTDFRMVQCLRQLGEVDIIYLEKKRFKSIAAALLSFAFSTVRSLSGRYSFYFSRGLLSSTLLVLLRPFTRSKIVHQALSVPLPSKEIYYVPHGSRESTVRYYVFSFLEKNMLSRVDAITVASEEYSDALVKIGVKRNKIWVIPFSVEKAFFEQPIKEDTGEVFAFCYVGRFHLYHVLVPLVQAFGFLSQGEMKAELLLVGDGVLRPKVEKEVTERKLSDRIKFTGIISRAELPFFLSAVDCFVLLSQAPGMPIGLLEAAAAGKPILTLRRAYDKTLNSYFEHGKEIYMVENSSPKLIAQAFEELYSNSSLRQSLALGARKIAKQYFSEEVTIGKIGNLIKHFQ